MSKIEQVRHQPTARYLRRRRGTIAGVDVLLAMIAAPTSCVAQRLTHNARWVQDAPKVQQLLNERYADLIRYTRTAHGLFRTQTTFIDGRRRIDCGVYGSDADPHLACVREPQPTPAHR